MRKCVELTAANKRESNFELYRIIVMLLIIAHHYVVNSGLTWVEGTIYSYPKSLRSVFLLLFGAWGKTGINCFVLITGYFMCKSKISLKKFVKFLLEIEFYRVSIYLIFCVDGYEVLSVEKFCSMLWPIDSVSTGFTSCYLLFYLLIPYLNLVIENMNERMHILLIGLSLFIYTVLGTASGIPVVMNYVSWFAVLYFISAYLRCYPKLIFENSRFWGLATVLCILVSVTTVVCRSWESVGDVYYYLSDSNKLLAVATAVCSFMFFKNLKIGYNRFINVLAASTFGVLQIHASSDAMRTWLWQDTLRNVEMYASAWMPLHAVGSVLLIFVVCTGIDVLRIHFIERPFFIMWDKHYNRFLVWYQKLESHIMKRCNIKE